MYSNANQLKKQRQRAAVFTTIGATITTILCMALFYFCLSNLYQHTINKENYTGFFGVGEALVQSTSMEPKLSTDDLIFYIETDAKNLTHGDIVVYKKTKNGSTSLIVHELVSISADGYVITKGINNDTQDEKFPISQIIGKYIFKIPKVGAVLDSISTVWALIIITCVLLIVLICQLAAYYAKKRKIINSISTDKTTKIAINEFFDL